MDLPREWFLGFFSLGYGGRLKQLLFWFKTVIKLYTSSFLRELCAFITGWGPSFVSQVKSTWKPASPGKFSHFSTRDSFAQGCQSVPLGASFPGNLPLYSWGSFHALEPYKGSNSSVASFPYKEVWTQQLLLNGGCTHPLIQVFPWIQRKYSAFWNPKLLDMRTFFFNCGGAVVSKST